MITYIKLHIYYIITNIFTKHNSKFYHSKLYNHLYMFQEDYYFDSYNSMPLLIYIHSFKSNPYPQNHIITKILIKLFNKPFYN